MKHVVIIGAGYAGAAAAVACATAGARVTLLEATDRLGGRASSFIDAETGAELDNGQHLMIGAYASTFDLLNTLGTFSLLTPQSAFGVTFVHAGGRRTTLGAWSLLSGAAGFLGGILTSSHLSFSERFALLRGAARMRTVHHHAIESLTITQLLDMLDQPPALRGKFWTPFVLAVMNNTPDRAAATLLVEVVRRVFFTTRDAARLMLPAVGLSDLLAPLPQWLAARGSELRLSCAAAAIASDGEGTRVVLQSGEQLFCDAVISAVPPHRLRLLLSPDDRARTPFSVLDAYEYSPIITVTCAFDRPVMNELFLGSTDTTVQWIFNRTAITRRTDGGQTVAMVISAAPAFAELSIDEIRDHCLSELRVLLPATAGATVRWSKVIKEKRATFVCTPSIEGRRPGPATAMRNVYLAGDWTHTGLPATIEGAALSGVSAARTACELLGIASKS